MDKEEMQRLSQHEWRKALEYGEAHKTVHEEVCALLTDLTVEQLMEVKLHICNLKPGEPFFVLRGQDESADRFIRMWIDGNLNNPGITAEKIWRASAIARACTDWPQRKAAD